MFSLLSLCARGPNELIRRTFLPDGTAHETTSNDEMPSLTWAPLSPSSSTAPSSQPLSPSTSQESSTTSLGPAFTSQRVTFEEAIRASVPLAQDEDAAAILKLLLDLPKRERLLCQFNPRHLQTKIAQALEITRIQESEEEELW